MIIRCVEISKGKVSTLPYPWLHIHIILSQPKVRTAKPNSYITLGLGKPRFLSFSKFRVYTGVMSQIKISDFAIFAKIASGMSGEPTEPLESSRSSIDTFFF